ETLYTGLMERNGAAGAYKYAGSGPGGAVSGLKNGVDYGDNFGRFNDLPFRVVQPDGSIKENNFWQWASYPLDRTSAFAKGHFDVSDNVRITGSAMFTRTSTETNLGLTADNITFWGFTVPFGTQPYTGNPTYNVPDSCALVNGLTNRQAN